MKERRRYKMTITIIITNNTIIVTSILGFILYRTNIYLYIIITYNK